MNGTKCRTNSYVRIRDNFYSFFGFTGKWVKYIGDKSLLEYAVKVGIDNGGCTLYVGRAFHNGKILPATVNLDHEIAYVCSKGLEHVKKDFEVRWIIIMFYFIYLRILRNKTKTTKISTSRYYF